MIHWWNIDLGPHAAEAAAQAVRNKTVHLGPLVEQFEARMARELGVAHIVGTSSGTTALMLALHEAGVGPGDEVIVPNRTQIAPANAAHMLGATVVLADVLADRPLLDPQAFESAITPRTKAVTAVHLLGLPVDMVQIRAIAEKHGIAVIEDGAQAMYVPSPEGGHLGMHSRAGCFSLSISKVMTSGQGGFLAAHSAEQCERFVLARTQGTKDVTKPRWVCPGANFRFSDLQAAVALAQFDLIPKRIASLRRIHAQYVEGLHKHEHICFINPVLSEGCFSIYIQVLVPQRQNLVEYLLRHDIETRNEAPSLNTAPHFAKRNPGPFPNSVIFQDQTMFLPSGPDQSEDDVARVIEVINTWRPGV